MRFEKKSIDYQLNMEAFYEMDECVPMTKSERNALRSWVKQGNDIETNPWEFADSDGWPLNYLQAYRLKHGYSSGPWDYWKGLKINLCGITRPNVSYREKTTVK